MDLELTNKRVVLTGGTRGIGRAIAERLLQEGCWVGICARNAEEVARAVGELRQLALGNAQVIGMAVDVADTQAVVAWVAAAAAQFGGLDIAIANVSALSGAPDEASWRLAMEIDMLGTVRLVEAALHVVRCWVGCAVKNCCTDCAWEHSGPRSAQFAAV